MINTILMLLVVLLIIIWRITHLKVRDLRDHNDILIAIIDEQNRQITKLRLFRSKMHLFDD